MNVSARQLVVQALGRHQPGDLDVAKPPRRDLRSQRGRFVSVPTQGDANVGAAYQELACQIGDLTKTLLATEIAAVKDLGRRAGEATRWASAFGIHPSVEH